MVHDKLFQLYLTDKPTDAERQVSAIMNMNSPALGSRNKPSHQTVAKQRPAMPPIQVSPVSTKPRAFQSPVKQQKKSGNTEVTPERNQSLDAPKAMPKTRQAQKREKTEKTERKEEEIK